jgi:type VI secretion system protein ImpC
MTSEKPISFGSLEFNLVSSVEETDARVRAESPCRILVMGDFSGRACRGALRSVPSIRDLRPIEVDRDTFEELPARLGTALSLALSEGDAPLTIQFEELGDFHPDRLFDRMDIFQKLRQIRRELRSDATFTSAAAEVQSLLGDEPQTENEKTSDAPPPVSSGMAVPPGNLLDLVLKETAGDPSPSGEASVAGDTGLEKFLKSLVVPHLVSADNPREEELVAAVDGIIAGLMRAILHHADFQALEAAWRGLHFLLSRLETDEHLQVFMLDLSRQEMAADLQSTSDLGRTGMHGLLVERAVETPGAVPWTVVVGDYSFACTMGDAEILGRMSRICAQAGAPFLAEADPSLVGCESLASTPDPEQWQLTAGEDDRKSWAAFRKLPEASFIGLALPGFMLRLPYGEATDAIDRFAFEEIEGTVPVHFPYLWGNPGFACACLLGQAYSRSGRQFQPGEILDLDDLPLHVYKEKGETRIMPCAGVLLTLKAVECILDRGLMPLLSFMDQDKVRLARFQSMADPLTRLSGPWT